MATIPIEVIVQDVETPVEPTPTPETNSTEESIAVPDTGAETIGSNGTFSNSSVASIIVPAVLLVLSLAAVCTLLVHRHKHQDAKASKKEKLAASASTIMTVLAATVLVGNLVLPATKAATSDITDAITPAEGKISIAVTRDGGSAEASIQSTVTITSTSDFGYKVLLSMAEGVETNNLYLDGDTTSEHYIATTESAELTDNTWGYAFAEDSEYSAIPLLDDAIVVAQGDGPVEDETLSVYYGVKISSDLPTGTYSGGEIEYNLVALEPTIGALTYMQDFAKLSESSKASVLRSMTEDQQYYLKDNRDDKTYRIAKLKDGNVWMTQNLDLQKEDLLEGVSIDDNNTDNPIANYILPDSQTSGNESWGSYNSETAINTSHIYDIEGDGKTYHYCLEYYHGSCSEYSEEAIPVTNFGNYYNWYAATAGTGTYSSSDKAIASGSICPAGWRLPDGNSSGTTDYSELLYAYSILTDEISGSYNSEKLDILDEAPLFFIYSGMYNQGANITGDRGYLWTSTARSNATTYYFGYAKDSLYLYSDDGKFEGKTMRCLVK